MASQLLSRYRATLAEETDEFSWEAEATLSAPGSTDWYIIPGGIDHLSVAITMAVGTAKLEYTIASQADIDGDTIDANDIFAWDAGSVLVPTDDILDPTVKAVRMTNTSGTTKLLVSAK
jgi:hypothetical protein